MRLAAASPASAALEPALASIWAYAEQNRAFMSLPGLTLGLAIPGFSPLSRHFGFANVEARSPLTDSTLWQVGSISKLMAAAVIHQLAGEGRFKLNDPIALLLPDLPIPAGDGITVQHLLDHVSGLPADAPLFPPGGLWTGFRPAAHWSYSNTGYDILGKLAEHASGKPLAQILRQRLFDPLAMRQTHGAITADQRSLFAQGYEPINGLQPFVRGTALAPAAWLDITFAAGSIASTAKDMVVMMRSLASAAQGRGGLGLSPAAGRAYAGHSVASDSSAMRYGNGLMHVGANGRSYLHHTGGMVSSSSSFHLDPLTGIGAFASSSISAFASYRPRLLTLYAIEAIGAALAGRPIPRPPALGTRVERGADYAGVYSGPSGEFTIKPTGTGLVILADGREERLEPSGDERFATAHPRFRDFSLRFERPSGGAVQGASWGAATFVRKGSTWTPPASDPDLARLAGRYFSDSPWFGGLMIVERGAKLWVGTDVPLVRLQGDLWRVGSEAWSPERLRFADRIDGRPQSIYFSGEKLVRHDI